MSDPTSREDTEGRQRLAAWFEQDPTRSRAGLGRKLGITGQAVSLWVAGRCPPDESIWELLQTVTGIPGELFLTDGERQRRDERRARLAALRESALGSSEPDAARASTTPTD